MNELHDIDKINVDIDEIQNDLTKQKNITLSILRLDKIHPEISGNKLFKLHYFLEKAINCFHKKIITFGGAYSNHLAAAAFAAKQCRLTSIGIIRGEIPLALSHTLLFCQQQGMHLEFISRENYLSAAQAGKTKNEEDFKNELLKKYGEHVLIPEGGFGEEGVNGAAQISNFYKDKNFTHVCCAVGTATTLAGLIKASNADQKIIGISALKKFDDFETRMQTLNIAANNYSLITDYNFGGYAKKNDELISFTNRFYNEFKIPTDFVYTAKMMFGVFDLIKKNYFDEGSKIICLHTGGLQGNFSLAKNTLNF